jgi:H/ACA ribonucleoprotein complex subunit 3
MKLLKCRKCGIYTMREECQKCGSKTGTTHPPKYSVEDKYAKYRRKEKYGENE